jgi:hypothetical protein
MKETEKMRRENSAREHVKQLQGVNEPERAGGTKVRVTREEEIKRKKVWRGYKQTEMESSIRSITKIQESETSKNMLKTAKNPWLREWSSTNVKSDKVLSPVTDEMVYFNEFDETNRIMRGTKVIFVLTQKTLTVLFRNN